VDEDEDEDEDEDGGRGGSVKQEDEGVTKRPRKRGSARTKRHQKLEMPMAGR